MLLPCSINSQINEQTYKKYVQENINQIVTSLALSLLALGLVVGGSRLLALAVTPSVIHTGFGFVYSFFGYHVLALGYFLLLSSLLSVALASLQRHRLNKVLEAPEDF